METQTQDTGFAAERAQMIARAAAGEIMLTGQVRTKYGISKDDLVKHRETLPEPVYEADEETVIEQPLSAQDIDLHLSSLESTTIDLDKQIETIKRRFLNAASVTGDHVDDGMRTKAWREALPQLQADEQNILAEIRNATQALDRAQQHVGVLDQALDISADDYAKSAAILPMIDREVSGLRGPQVLPKLQSITARGDKVLTLAWIHACLSWADKHPTDGDVSKIRAAAKEAERSFRSTAHQPVSKKAERIRTGLLKAEARIRRARQARGQMPDFLNGLNGMVKSREPEGRIHGYEK